MEFSGQLDSLYLLMSGIDLSDDLKGRKMFFRIKSRPLNPIAKDAIDIRVIMVIDLILKDFLYKFFISP